MYLVPGARLRTLNANPQLLTVTQTATLTVPVNPNLPPDNQIVGMKLPELWVCGSGEVEKSRLLGQRNAFTSYDTYGMQLLLLYFPDRSLPHNTTSPINSS